MKCPACQAYNPPDALTCKQCGENLGKQSTPKQTMMGLPSIFGAAETSDERANPQPAQKSTLYGFPALANPLSEASEASEANEENDPGEPGEVGEDEDEDDRQPGSSTRIAPRSVVEAALTGSYSADAYDETPVSEELAQDHARWRAGDTGTAAPNAIPADKDEEEQFYGRLWGLDEESSEASVGSTQVVGASLIDSLSQHAEDASQDEDQPQDAHGFSKARSKGRQPQNTLMGIHLDLYQEPRESTHEIDDRALEKIRQQSAAITLDGDSRLKAAMPPDAAAPGPATEALSPNALGELEEKMAQDRRQKLLAKLRKNTDKPDESGAAAESQNRDAPAAGALGPAKPMQIMSGKKLPRPTADPGRGPRFAIPTVEESEPVDPTEYAELAELSEQLEPVDSASIEDGGLSGDAESPAEEVEQVSFVSAANRQAALERVSESAQPAQTSFPIDAAAASHISQDGDEPAASGGEAIGEEFVEREIEKYDERIEENPAVAASASGLAEASGAQAPVDYSSFVEPQERPSDEVEEEVHESSALGATSGSAAPNGEADRAGLSHDKSSAPQYQAHENMLEQVDSQIAPVTEEPPARPTARLKLVSALVAMVGLFFAALGILFFLLDEIAGFALPEIAAGMLLAGGCVLFVCALLFPLMLKWVS